MGSEIFHALQEAAARRRPQHQCRRRGRLRAQPRNRPTRRSSFIMQAIETAGYQPGEDVVLALDPGVERVLQGRQIRAGRRGQDARCRRAWSRYYEDLVAALSRSSRSRTACAEDDWDGWKLLTERWAARSSSSATTSSSPTPSGCAAASSAASANAILIKVNQIGTLTETLETVEIAHRAGYARGDRRTARARPRTRPSPISRWRPTAARSRPARLSRTDRLAKYNQLIRIEEELGAAARYAGRAALARA